MKEVTPKLIPELVTELANHDYRDPVEVKVVPHTISNRNECWENVRRLVRDEGGELVSGRIVWTETRGYWLHLEAHAVWRRPDREIIDPTPKDDGEETIVFVAEDLEFVDRMIPSRYLATTDNPDVLRLIELLIKVQEIQASVPAGEEKRFTASEIEVIRNKDNLIKRIYFTQNR